MVSHCSGSSGGGGDGGGGDDVQVSQTDESLGFRNGMRIVDGVLQCEKGNIKTTWCVSKCFR